MATSGRNAKMNTRMYDIMATNLPHRISHGLSDVIRRRSNVRRCRSADTVVQAYAGMASPMQTAWMMNMASNSSLPAPERLKLRSAAIASSGMHAMKTKPRMKRKNFSERAVLRRSFTRIGLKKKFLITESLANIPTPPNVQFPMTNDQ